MSFLGIQGVAITRIEHTRKTEAAASAAKAGRTRNMLKVLGEAEYYGQVVSRAWSLYNPAPASR